MLIGVHGVSRSGKDTCCEYLQDTYNFEIRSFGDKMREIAYETNPIVGCRSELTWDEDIKAEIHEAVPVYYADLIDSIGYEAAKDQYPEVVSFLQRFATEGLRECVDNLFWVKLATRDLVSGQSYCWKDTRFPDEGDFIRSLGGFVIKIERPGYGPVNDHKADRSLEDYDFDFIINNNGSLAHFYAQIDTMMDRIEKTLVREARLKYGESWDGEWARHNLPA